MKQVLVLLTTAAILLISCKKEDAPDYNTTTKAPLSAEFDNVVGSSDLQLNTGSYTNALGENFKVTKLKYYVSNFKLTNVNGTMYTVPQDSCYFLVDESYETTLEPILNVPEGEYKSISFMIGVDSLRNAADISKRTGVLDLTTTAADMYWGWNSGYIFFKMEGTSPVVTGMGNDFMYHIGGFGGYATTAPNNLKTITLDLTARGTPKVKTGKGSNIHLFVDILKAIDGSTNMSFAAAAMIHSPAVGVPVANNYVEMFKHDHTEN